VLRLTFDADKLNALQPLMLEQRHCGEDGTVAEGFSSALHIDWIDVALFPQKVGFLIIRLRLDDDVLSADRFKEILFHLRTIHPQVIGWPLAQWRTIRGGDVSFRSVDLVDFLLQGFTDADEPMHAKLAEYLAALEQAPNHRRYSDTTAGQVYGELFRQYSNARLEGDDAAHCSASAASPAEQADALFDSPTIQLFYELASCSDADTEDYRPHPHAVEKLLADSYIALWSNWQGLALHDNVIFLGTADTPFVRRSLPHNVSSDYFHLYLLSLYQKFRLSFFAGELMRRDTDLHTNIEQARSLWERFLLFRNRNWFAEVTLKPQGMHLYQRFHQGLGVRALFDSTAQSVNDLQVYYERKAELDMQEATRQLQQSTKESTEVIATVQKRVEWLEVLIVSIYFVELAHVIVPRIPLLQHYEWQSILGGAVLGMVTGLAILRPWRH